jgi:hypothetical protein
MTFFFNKRINKSFIIIEKKEHSLIRNVNLTFIQLKDEDTTTSLFIKRVALDNSNYKGYLKFIDHFYFQINLFK